MVGQDAVVRTLRTALSTGKVAHAYLFSGPRGSGKTSAAKILARCIECERGPTPDPDNTCENCRAILAGTALDVIEIDAASNRGIDEIRALRDSVKFAPAAMRSKVFIIDEAHMLTREGANAFLRTLEEPPAHAVFILATTAPEALPPTVLSRCQRYAFRRIAIPTMIERMRAIAAAEGIPIDDDALGAIAYRADGGLRDALTMLEQVAAFSAGGDAGETIGAQTVDAAFGVTGRAYARRLVEAVLAGDARESLRVVDEASDAGTDMLSLARSTIAELRNLLVARIDPDLLRGDLASEDAAVAVRLGATTPQVKLVRGLRLLGDALGAARASGNPRLELETAVLRLAVVQEDSSLDGLAARVALLETGAAPPGRAAAAPAVPPTALAEPLPEVRQKTRPAAPPATEPPAASHAPATNISEGERRLTVLRVRSLWEQIRRRAEEEYKPMRGALSRATVDAVEGNAVTIGFPDRTTVDTIVRPKVAVIERALSEVLGTPIRVILNSGGQGGGTPGSGTPLLSRSPHRSAPRPEGAATNVAPAAAEGDDEDLLAYARKQLGGSPPR